jgi:branched-chain amino acid transport system ATP-binding protein
MLEITNLTKHFGGLTAVKDFSCEVNKGEIVGLIGPNGAGKTTVFNMVSGFIRANEGQVVFEGHNITHSRPDQICHRGLCRTFQIVKPFGNTTVLNNVVIGALAKRSSVRDARMRALEMVRLVGLYEYRNALAKGMTIGNRKRLEVARALATEPRLLLLDEPMGGLNPTEVMAIMGLLREIVKEGVTILLIEHVMQAIMNVSDRIVVLHHGEKIAEGEPRAIASDRRVIEAYLGGEYCIA